MSFLKNVEDGIKDFISKLWLKLEPTVHTAISDAGHAAVQVAVAAGTAALVAGKAVHATGGSTSDVKDAALDAAKESIKTVGVTIGTNELSTLAVMIQHAITDPVLVTPPAPAAS